MRLRCPIAALAYAPLRSLLGALFVVMNFGVGESSGGQLTASWLDNSGGEAAFAVERRVTGGAFTAIANVPQGSTVYVDAAVTDGVTYCYRVRAYTAAGYSAYSNDACGTSAALSGYSFTISRTGSGTGTVTSTPAGINCGTDCTETYNAGTVVTLAATPASGSKFDGWSGGGCTGTSTCTLLGNAPVLVTATFSQLSVTAPSSTSGANVGSLTLINADTDQPVPGFDPLQEGAIIDLAKLSTRRLNIRANTSPAIVGSVRFGLDSNAKYSIENTAPYALGGEKKGDYSAWTPTLGSHVVAATPYSGSNGSGTSGASLLRKFSVVDSSTTTIFAVTSLTLVDAATGRPIPGFDPLPDGAALDPRTLPAGVALRANTSPAQVGSVLFGYNGNLSYRTENGAPYALHGDTNGTYYPWKPQSGTYEVIATPYSGANASGSRGAAIVRRFTVVSTSSTAPASGTATSLVVTSLTPPDATTGRPVPRLDPLREGAGLDLNPWALPASVALRAHTSSVPVGSVRPRVPHAKTLIRLARMRSSPRTVERAVLWLVHVQQDAPRCPDRPGFDDTIGHASVGGPHEPG
jgi:hypothetical protein